MTGLSIWIGLYSLIARLLLLVISFDSNKAHVCYFSHLKTEDAEALEKWCLSDDCIAECLETREQGSSSQIQPYSKAQPPTTSHRWWVSLSHILCKSHIITLILQTRKGLLENNFPKNTQSRSGRLSSGTMPLCGRAGQRSFPSDSIRILLTAFLVISSSPCSWEGRWRRSECDNIVCINPRSLVSLSGFVTSLHSRSFTFSCFQHITEYGFLITPLPSNFYHA